jgi:hypothetical protein
MKRPPMNWPLVLAAVCIAVPMQTIRQPMKMHLRRKCCNLAKIVDDEDDTSTRASAGKTEGLLILGHCIDGAHERAVKPVHGRHQISYCYLCIDQHNQVTDAMQCLTINHSRIIPLENIRGFCAAVAAARAAAAGLASTPWISPIASF